MNAWRILSLTLITLHTWNVLWIFSPFSMLNIFNIAYLTFFCLLFSPPSRLPVFLFASPMSQSLDEVTAVILRTFTRWREAEAGIRRRWRKEKRWTDRKWRKRTRIPKGLKWNANITSCVTHSHTLTLIPPRNILSFSLCVCVDRLSRYDRHLCVPWAWRAEEILILKNGLKSLIALLISAHWTAEAAYCAFEASLQLSISLEFTVSRLLHFHCRLFVVSFFPLSLSLSLASFSYL